MSEKMFETGVVSWATFEALYKQSADCFRKMAFLVRAAQALKDEEVALDTIADFLEQKEKIPQQLREVALRERDRAGGPGVKIVQAAAEPMEELTPGVEDMDIFNKLMEVRRKGGHGWDNLKVMIEGTHAAQAKVARGS